MSITYYIPIYISLSISIPNECQSMIRGLPSIIDTPTPGSIATNAFEPLSTVTQKALTQQHHNAWLLEQQVFLYIYLSRHASQTQNTQNINRA